MNKSENKYLINNNAYSANKLLDICLHKIESDLTPDWEKDIYSFINDWLNTENSIEVETSGSTGNPKRIKLKKWQLIESARQTGKFFNLNKGDKALLCLPVSSIAGKMMIVRSFVLGLDLYYVKPQGNPLTNNEEEYDFSAMTPHQVSNIITDGGDINKINTLIIGGGQTSSDLIKRLQEFDTHFFATYGMTETITHIALQKLNGPNKQESFQVFPGIELRIDNRDCLCIRTPYLEDEIITNDIVNIIEKNQFVFVGRIDNVINSGGIKIYPEEIENLIKDSISDPFFITSKSDEILGNKLILVIEGQEYDVSKKDQLITNLRLTLNPYQIPKEIKFIDKFRVTDSGKVIRRI